MAGNARYMAAAALAKVHGKGGYSNIVLDNELEATGLSGADKALFSRLFYGVIERRLTLDHLLAQYCATPLKKLHPLVREILRTGAYQLLYMDRIPASAAVNEAVTLARSVGQPRAAGMVNAVLRRVDREGKALIEALPHTPAGNSLRYSCPEELLKLWSEAYGAETALALAKAGQEAPAAYLRVNTLKTDRDRLTAHLTEHTVSYKTDDILQNCICLATTFDRKTLAPETKNWYYHQDRASQLCCEALGAQPGERIADVCAAPGGKSLTLAQYMQNRGSIMACDLYDHKCRVMAQRAAEYGATCIEARVRDAALPCEPELKGRFHRVLCDVPCSGLGVIRRKPEIRYKPPESLKGLPELQYQILCASADLVCPGGRLQYSTCTLNPAENQAVAERFLREHPDYEPVTLPLTDCFAAAGIAPSWQITLMPHIHGTDGFFIAAMRKTTTDTSGSNASVAVKE